MPKSKPPYPAEFRARMIDLVRSGRSVRGLSREFGVTETTIHSWVRQADLDSGRRKDGLTTEERQELSHAAQGKRPPARGAGHIKKSSGLVRPGGGRAGAQDAFRFVRANQADHAASMSCRMLGISESGFYAWRSRPPSRRATDDAELIVRIKAIHEMSDGTYGAPRIQAELADVDGRIVNRKRVARLMRQAGIA